MAEFQSNLTISGQCGANFDHFRAFHAKILAMDQDTVSISLCSSLLLSAPPWPWLRRFPLAVPTARSLVPPRPAPPRPSISIPNFQFPISNSNSNFHQLICSSLWKMPLDTWWQKVERVSFVHFVRGENGMGPEGGGPFRQFHPFHQFHQFHPFIHCAPLFMALFMAILPLFVFLSFFLSFFPSCLFLMFELDPMDF